MPRCRPLPPRPRSPRSSASPAPSPTARRASASGCSSSSTRTRRRSRTACATSSSYALQGRYDVEAIDTQSRDHATEICREAAHEGYDVVVSFGGDGTVNEAANGLAGSQTPLSCLPGGATNVLCKMLGIPGDIVDATEHLLRLADDWRPRRIDLARVNGRHFTFTAGLGLDAAVVKHVDERPNLKSKMGAFYFTYAAITTFTRDYWLNPPKLEVRTPDGGVHRGVTAIVQNGDPFTYFNYRPIVAAEGATAGLRRPRGDRAGAGDAARRAGHRATARWASARACSSTAASAASRGSPSSLRHRSTGGRCRCRSTATTSAT